MTSCWKKSILEMNNKEAKNFFMKEESYCSLKLPEYFSFSKVLKKADTILSGSVNNSDYCEKRFNSIQNSKAKERDISNINCNIVINKDGKYDWRPVKIVHPVAYVDLVNLITSFDNWQIILDKFKDFRKNNSINCISMPIKSLGIHNNDTKETIISWWEQFEQNSIEAALEYTYCIQTDVTNCYGSIYTHTITWALIGKKEAKKSRKGKRKERNYEGKIEDQKELEKKKLGDLIDKKIRCMQYGQTNGIPQGGKLFDFIAELVLGYADFKLGEELKTNKITNYKIIRYRDDYRIFSNSKEELDLIVKLLSYVLSDLNMHFNLKKTKYTTDLIGSSIKPDKLYWNSRSISIFSNNKYANGKKIKSDYKVYHMSLQKHLLEIYILSKKFPNSGSIKKAFSEYLDRLDKLKSLPEDYKQIISITANIIIANPNSIPQGVAVIGCIFNLMKNTKNYDPKNVKLFINRILKKLKSIPNTEYVEIWLQRISVVIDKNDHSFRSPLCEKVRGKDSKIWNSDWLGIDFDDRDIVDTNTLKNIGFDISKESIDPFSDPYEY